MPKEKDDHPGYSTFADLAKTQMLTDMRWNQRNLASLANMGWIETEKFRETGNCKWVKVETLKDAIGSFIELQEKKKVKKFPDPNDLDKQI